MDLKAKCDELESDFHELDKRRQAHLAEAQKCHLLMVKVEGAWETLRALLDEETQDKPPEGAE